MIVLRRPAAPYHYHQPPAGNCAARRQHPCSFFFHDLEKETNNKKSEKQESPESSPSEKKIDQKEKRTVTLSHNAPIHRKETEEDVTLSFDIAGFVPDDLEIKLESSVLSVKGRRQNKLGDTCILHRRFALKKSVYDEDTTRATFDEGILEISIQKKAPTTTTPRVVPIHSRSSGDIVAKVEETKEVSTVDKDDSKNDEVKEENEEAATLGGDHEVSTSKNDESEELNQADGPAINASSSSAEEETSSPPRTGGSDDDAWEDVTVQA